MSWHCAVTCDLEGMRLERIYDEQTSDWPRMADHNVMGDARSLQQGGRSVVRSRGIPRSIRNSLVDAAGVRPAANSSRIEARIECQRSGESGLPNDW